MSIRTIYLLMFLGLSNPILACSCAWFDSESAKQSLYESSDFVIKGHPIKNMHPTFSPKNQKYMGKDILFKVDSVYKGVISIDTIFIIQSRSNCSIFFADSNEYWIFGDVVKEIKLLDENIDKFSDEGYDKENMTFHLMEEKGVFDIYKSLQFKYLTLETNQCVTFNNNDKLMVDFIRRKRIKKD